MEQLKNLYLAIWEGEPWYGKAVGKILEELTEDDMDLRLGHGLSIRELIWHMIAWRTFTIRRLSGISPTGMVKAESFRLLDPSVHTWHAAQEELSRTQVQILTLISKEGAYELNAKVWEKRYTWYELLHGLLHHEIYHAGQIQLILKGGKP